jgi:hypothetical protein
MIVRSAPLLAATLACLASPALAQDQAPALEPLLEAEAPGLPPLPEPVTIAPQPLPEPTADGGWQGEWQGEWAPDGTWNGTWTGSYADPGPTATRAIYPAGVAGMGYSSAERTAWLNQCRNAYYPASAATGAVAASVQPDTCEAYLLQYERNAAMAAQGAAYSQGAYPPGGYAPAPMAYAPGAYAPGAYGNPYAPVMWVRVPIVREPAQPARTVEVEE